MSQTSAARFAPPIFARTILAALIMTTEITNYVMTVNAHVTVSEIDPDRLCADNRYMKRMWIIDRLREAGRTQRALASEMGVPPSRVTDIISGKREVKVSELPAFAATLSLPIEKAISLLDGAADVAAVDVSWRAVPIVGEVAAGFWREAIERPEDEWVYAHIPAANRNEEAFGLRVTGRSMDRVFPPGSLLVCVSIRAYNGEIADGQYVICERRNELNEVEATVKQLDLRDGAVWLWPRSTDPRHQSPIRVSINANDDTPATDEIEAGARISAIVVSSFQVHG